MIQCAEQLEEKVVERKGRQDIYEEVKVTHQQL